MTDVEASYQANTVEELRDELRSRGLHVTGTKDELIARLEEDDAAQEVPGKPPKPDQSPPIDAGADNTLPMGEGEAEEVPDYYPPRIYSPYELPANTAQAQAFLDANPEAVDVTLVLPPERQEIALAAIQAHVDTMAEAGVVVEDPRLTGGDGGGGEGPAPEPIDPEITGVDPNTATMGVETQVTLTGTSLAGVTGVQIGPNEGTDLTATDTEVTFNITGLAPATDTIVGLMVGDRLVPSNFTFTFTAP